MLLVICFLLLANQKLTKRNQVDCPGNAEGPCETRISLALILATHWCNLEHLFKKKKQLCPRPLNQYVCFEVRYKLGI